MRPLQPSKAFSQSRNEALNYVENNIYFETSDSKMLVLMIGNIEITIKYPSLSPTLVNINSNLWVSQFAI